MSEYAETSRKAYAQLVASGSIGRIQAVVYKFIAQNQDSPEYHGGISRANVKARFNDESDSFVPRIAELLRMGLIHRASKKLNDECMSGHEVFCHRVTKRQVPLPKVVPLPRIYFIVIRKPMEVFKKGYKTKKKAMKAARSLRMDRPEVSPGDIMLLVVQHDWSLEQQHAFHRKEEV